MCRPFHRILPLAHLRSSLHSKMFEESVVHDPSSATLHGVSSRYCISDARVTRRVCLSRNLSTSACTAQVECRAEYRAFERVQGPCCRRMSRILFVTRPPHTHEGVLKLPSMKYRVQGAIGTKCRTGRAFTKPCQSNPSGILQGFYCDDLVPRTR